MAEGGPSHNPETENIRKIDVNPAPEAFDNIKESTKESELPAEEKELVEAVASRIVNPPDRDTVAENAPGGDRFSHVGTEAFKPMLDYAETLDESGKERFVNALIAEINKRVDALDRKPEDKENTKARLARYIAELIPLQ